jgi:Holliday junction resolvase
MGAMSRTKGANGERELARLLSDELGVEVTRNLMQTRDGGHDLNGLSGWCLEAKRRAKVTEGEKRQWWAQAVRQSGEFAERGTPVVAYRADRGEWRFMLPLCAIQGYPGGAMDMAYPWAVEMGVEPFCLLVRESLGAANGR